MNSGTKIVKGSSSASREARANAGRYGPIVAARTRDAAIGGLAQGGPRKKGNGMMTFRTTRREFLGGAATAAMLLSGVSGARAAGKTASQIGLTFVPHLTPMIRGIHATLYARITREEDFQALFEQRYADEPFVDVLPPKSHPETRSVRAANTCRIALHRPQGGDTLVVLSVIDNLVKGAAGQAVQNMNIMFGVDECSGLSQVPVLP